MNIEICKRCLLKQYLNDYNASEEVTFSAHTREDFLVIIVSSKTGMFKNCFQEVSFNEMPPIRQEEKSIKWDEMYLADDSDCFYYLEHIMYDWNGESEH